MDEVESVEKIISGYFIDTINAIKLLYSNDLIGQTMILMFSTIDAVGLLNSPKAQKHATKDSFKAWVKKYMLRDNDLEYSSIDLWASRCATLHTFTTSSDLTNKGKAREILFYSADPQSRKVSDFNEYADSLINKKYVTANIELTVDAFCNGLKIFARELDAKCQKNEVYLKRVREIMRPQAW